MKAAMKPIGPDSQNYRRGKTRSLVIDHTRGRIIQVKRMNAPIGIIPNNGRSNANCYGGANRRATGSSGAVTVDTEAWAINTEDNPNR